MLRNFSTQAITNALKQELKNEIAYNLKRKEGNLEDEAFKTIIFKVI